MTQEQKDAVRLILKKEGQLQQVKKDMALIRERIRQMRECYHNGLLEDADYWSNNIMMITHKYTKKEATK